MQYKSRMYKNIILLTVCMILISNISYSQTKLVIIKHGTIDLLLVETTPVVFQDRLYRFEYVRDNYVPNKTGDTYFRFIDVETGKTTPAFAKGFRFGSAFVDGDTVYVTGTNSEGGWYGRKVEIFKSNDLTTWESYTALDLPNHGICNTSICKADGNYVMMFEIHEPKDEAGSAFTARFARSKDLITWTLTSPDCVYAKDRYTAPHCLRYLDGYFYNFYLEAHDGYEMRVVRSKDLIHWEASPLNPVLKASKDDKKIANANLSSEQIEIVKNADNLNNSDIDFCEYKGKTIINYSWGNQQGVEFLATATYDGPVDEFIRGFYPTMDQ